MKTRTPPRYVVIVTGSRHWTNVFKIRARINRYPAGTIVLHGDCDGADTIAKEAAELRGLYTIPHPYFGDLGKAGGPARNHLLVGIGMAYRDVGGYTVIVEAFPLPSSRGTVNCIHLAEAAGLPVVETHP